MAGAKRFMYSRTCLICHRLSREFAQLVTFSSIPEEFLSVVYISVRLIRPLLLLLRSVLFG